MESKIKKDKYSCYVKEEIPDDLNEMYENQYYQTDAGMYRAQYTEQEVRSFVRNAKKKELILQRYLIQGKDISFLDVGCGEGYVLDYFYKKGWKVMGLDLSDYGLMAHNPHMGAFLYKGDSNQILRRLAEEGKTFDVINADCSIECHKNAYDILEQLKFVMKPKTGLAIFRVANCVSPLHKELLNRGILQERNWFNRVGNSYYFCKESLKKALEELGYECLEWYGDTFVDFNLINPIANYYEVEGAGKVCYRAMLDIEDIMERESLDKMLELEKVMGDMGFGRHITCICRRMQS